MQTSAAHTLTVKGRVKLEEHSDELLLAVCLDHHLLAVGVTT